MGGLISVARRLAKPINAAQPFYKRALSTAYYALFQMLAQECADLLVGDGQARQSDEWLQACRALDHTGAKKACESLSKKTGFGTDIQKFADVFVTLQEKRHDADYNPRTIFKRNEVITWIDAAELAIRGFKNSPVSQRRRLAACVLLRKRN